MTTDWRMPGEWERHQRTYLGWPQWLEDPKKGQKDPAQIAFAAVAKAIAEFEPVTVAANPDQVDKARAALHESVEVASIPQNDSWFRDTGEAFVTRDGDNGKEIAGVNWGFDAYGGLNDEHELDDEIARCICKQADIDLIEGPMVLEAGSIHVDGEGTLISTEECLLNKTKRARNPKLSREQIEGNLKKLLGVTKIVWLPLGLYADNDTTGHVDNLACFAAPGKVLLAWTDDEKDPQYERSREAKRILEAATDAQGRKLEVIKLPLPDPLSKTAEEAGESARNKGGKGNENGKVDNEDEDDEQADEEEEEEDDDDEAPKAGDRMAASYINFYICNGGIVMPALGQEPADSRAQKVLEDTFPDRKVVAVPTRKEKPTWLRRNICRMTFIAWLNWPAAETGYLQEVLRVAFRKVSSLYVSKPNLLAVEGHLPRFQAKPLLILPERKGSAGARATHQRTRRSSRSACQGAQWMPLATWRIQACGTS
ncbi:hypothetical protein WJX74_002005 [Apatococcus lobatus]|uniref:Agmatine deiminase n=1 Tax=Apatococcus lobatus TaxID=904363 RepID=A0AAW1QC12_9CHLO